jgi:kynureninase
MAELLKWRGAFPILDRTTYMISNSLGAMPRGVYESLRSYADSWAERGVRAWEEGWWEMAVGEPSPIYEMRPTRNTVARFMSY